MWPESEAISDNAGDALLSTKPLGPYVLAIVSTFEVGAGIWDEHIRRGWRT